MEAQKKTYQAKGKRTLADGSVKEYVYNKSAQYKPVEIDRRHDGNAGRKEKMSPEQKEEAWQKHLTGVSIKRIARDMKVSYSTAYKCIDKRRCAQGVHAPPQ